MGNLAQELANKFFKNIQVRMLNLNKNWLSTICGDTGSGKSYSALSIADDVSPRGITIEDNVIFTPKRFFEIIKDKKNLMKGDILIFDEAGVGIPARDWYTIQNKLIGSVLQTFRFLNIGVIFTVPNLSFIDIQARKLFHNYFETIKIDYEEEVTYLKTYKVQHNSMLDKTYYKRPRIPDGDGRRIRVNFVGVQKPSAYLCKEYEKVKEEFNQQLNENAMEEMGRLELQHKKKDYKEIAQEVIAKHQDYLVKWGNKKIIDVDKIALEYSIGRNMAYTIKKCVEGELSL